MRKGGKQKGRSGRNGRNDWTDGRKIKSEIKQGRKVHVHRCIHIHIHVYNLPSLEAGWS